jgi:hypothetical protein
VAQDHSARQTGHAVERSGEDVLEESMKHHWIITLFDWIGTLCLLFFSFDNWRLRRRLRVDRLAREAEEALGPPHIGDIVMPDPSDPRWKWERRRFRNHLALAIDESVLVLGDIMVHHDGYVYIGNGLPIAGGEPYAKRVLHAYKRRLVEAARG